MILSYNGIVLVIYVDDCLIFTTEKRRADAFIYVHGTLPWTLPKVPGVKVVVRDFFLTVILRALKCE